MQLEAHQSPVLKMTGILDERAWKACAGLPIELVEKICVYAAEADRKCAHAMAFVSKRICKLTVNARWRIIAITSIPQFLAFVREIHAISDDDYNGFISLLGNVDASFQSLRLEGLHKRVEGDSQKEGNVVEAIQNSLARSGSFDANFDNADAKSQAFCAEIRKERRSGVISFPANGEPHENIRHLFFDLPELEDGLGQCLGPSSAWDAWKTIFTKAKKECAGCIEWGYYNIYGDGCYLHARFDHYFTRYLGSFCLDHLSIGLGSKYFF